MYKFKHEFRTLRPADGFDGCYPLPTGDKALILEIGTDDDSVTLLVSGSGCGDTIFTIVYEDKEYITVLPRFNMAHIVVADAIAEYLEEGKDDLATTVADVISDFQMV